MAGTVNVTASGIVLTSGKPVKVYGYSMVSAATGPGTVTFYNGTSASGTNQAQVSGTANGGSSSTFGVGKFFPAGLYLQLDADVTSVSLDCEQMQS